MNVNKLDSGNGCTHMDPPGINIQDALDELGIGMDIYKDILDIFVKANCDFMEKARNFYAAEDWMNLGQLAHSLKGSSGNIRANNLNKVCFELEMACKDFDSGKTGEKPDSGLLIRIENELAIVINSINKIEKTDGDTDKAENDLDRDDLIKACQDFINALQIFDPDKVKSGFMLLKSHMDDQSSQAIESYINNYEYDDAEKAFEIIFEEILKNN